MPEALIASSVLLWLTLIVLLIVVFALARQIGVLHERLSPSGSIAGASVADTGLALGAALPVQQLTDLHGRAITVGGPRGQATLLLFVSPTCPLCRSLAPLTARHADRHGLELLLVGAEGAPELHHRYAEALGLDAPYLFAPALGRMLGVSRLPFAALTDSSGVLRGSRSLESARDLDGLFQHIDALAHAPSPVAEAKVNLPEERVS